MTLGVTDFKYGAALINIAEHENFSAINSLRIKNKLYRNTFRINGDIALHLKYATKDNNSYGEYIFNFKVETLDDLKEISSHCNKTFIALICVEELEVCCISYRKLKILIASRHKKTGVIEEQYSILVSFQKNHPIKIAINHPDERGIYLKTTTSKKDAFPKCLF
jgi:hypothetical protein